MTFRKKGDAVLRCLAEVVGSRCSITLANGEVVSGVLSGFRRGSPFILYIEGKSRMFLNFHYVLKISVEEGTEYCR